MAKAKIDPYQQITDKIVAKLEQGEIPWKKPWKSMQYGAPMNMISGKAYRGTNFFMAVMEDRESPYWLTYKQATQLGGKVKKGERGLPIIYFTILEKEQADGKIKKIPMVRKSTVFNIEQCEGIENPTKDEIEKFKAETFTEFEAIESCEYLLSTFVDKVAPYEHTSHPKAYYIPSSDTINMPEKERFTSSAGYYATLFHEIGHSTGHKDRLDRDMTGNFGTKAYAREELVAELTSAFLCTKAGIVNDTVENNTAYIQGWLTYLKNDKMLVYDAMKEAYKAIEYMGILEEVEQLKEVA